MLSEAMVQVRGDAGVELPFPVADVHVPHEATRLRGGFWLPSRNPPRTDSQFAEGCTRGPGVRMGMGKPDQ